MTDDKVIPLWDRYKPRKSDDPTTAIRKLLLRRKFSTGERVHHCRDETECGTVIETDGASVKVLWDRSARELWLDVLDLRRVQNS
jgi:hypothetical protein